jgi:hypothetical protein
MTDAILESWKCKVQSYFIVNIQLCVVTYRPGLCIYSKCVVHTFLQKIGLIDCGAKEQIDRLESNKDNSKYKYDKCNEVEKSLKQDNIMLKKEVSRRY